MPGRQGRLSRCALFGGPRRPDQPRTYYPPLRLVTECRRILIRDRPRAMDDLVGGRRGREVLPAGSPDELAEALVVGGRPVVDAGPLHIVDEPVAGVVRQRPVQAVADVARLALHVLVDGGPELEELLVPPDRDLEAVDEPDHDVLLICVLFVALLCSYSTQV